MITSGNITIVHYLVLSSIIFSIGVYGLSRYRRSIISLLIAIELMLLATNINFIALSKYWLNYEGQIFSIFILTVTAAETAIGLAILICYFRNKGNIQVSEINHLKG